MSDNDLFKSDVFQRTAIETQKLRILIRMKNIILFVFSTMFITGCVPAFNHSIVIEKPKQPIKEMLIVIEQPAFAPPHDNNNTTMIRNLSIQGALFTYNVKMNKAAKENFVRVMSDNGIHSKLIFVQPVFDNTTQLLNVIPHEEEKNWQYVLWLRHVKGKASTSYNNSIVGFQLETKIFDTNTTKMIWNAKEADLGYYYGYLDWESGQLYRDILYRMSEDKMIELNSIVPKVNIK